MQSTRNDRSLGELFADLASQTGSLMRGEIAIAKAELAETAKSAGKDVGTMVIGGAVMYAGLLAIVSAAILLLANAVPAWLAALIAGVVVVVVGAFVLNKGRTALSAADLTPRQTLKTLSTDVDVMKGDRA